MKQFSIILLTLGLVGTVAGAILSQTSVVPTTSLPRCHEDQVLVGAGQYAGGTYSEWMCGPELDDPALRDYTYIPPGVVVDPTTGGLVDPITPNKEP